MQIIDRNIAEFMASIVTIANKNFLNAEAREMLKVVTGYGKSDTLGLDAIPEIDYVRAVEEYDNLAVLVTEETDKQTINKLPDTYRPNRQPLVFISDPTDRSKYLKEFILRLILKEMDEGASLVDAEKIVKESDITIRELWNKYEVCKEWENFFESPVSITGATSAITCISRGKAVCTAIVNYITGELTLACEKGVFHIDLSLEDNKRFILSDLCLERHKLSFSSESKREEGVDKAKHVADDMKRFVTFVGKEGYHEHFDSSKIFLGSDGVNKYLHHEEPGGPSRAMYLSELNSEESPIGLILANGEKITEWCHWLPFVKFSKNMEGERNLRIYEVYTKPIMAKKGIPMSVTADLSIFRERAGIGKFMDINKIGQFGNPSHFRSMIVICHRKNNWLIRVMKQNGYRDIGDYF